MTVEHRSQGVVVRRPEEVEAAERNPRALLALVDRGVNPEQMRTGTMVSYETRRPQSGRQA